MKANMTITVDLTPADIKQAILTYIRKTTPFGDSDITENDISFTVDPGYRGSDPREPDRQACLTGAKLRIKAQPATRSDYYMDR